LLGLGIYGLVTKYFVKPSSGESTFRVPRDQRIYIVARDDWVDNWNDDESREHVTVDIRAEQLVREEFIRMGKVRLTKNEQDADFIFLIVIDPSSTKQAVLAELDTGDCYKDSESSLARCDSKWVAWGDSPAHVVQRFYKDVVP